MSSYYGGGFDEWLEDSFYGLTEQQWAAVKAIMAPHRENIAVALEGFEPDEMSWRQFRNDLWYGYEDESAKIRAILRGELRPEDVLSPRTSEQEYGRLVSGAAA